MIALKHLFLLFTLVAATLASAQPKAPQPQQLELFGAKLKGATREQLRGAFEKGGLRPIRIDDKYWVDTYNPAGVLDGASGFLAGYVDKTRFFAFAEYEFQGFMDTGLVTKVASLVINKFGRPSTQSGSEGLGPVNYLWKLPQGMTIRVSRGWPDTTTYLTFADQAAHAELKAEQEADKQAAEKTKAKSQTKAF